MPYKVLTVQDGDADRPLDRQLEESLNQAERGGWQLLSLQQLPPRSQGARMLAVFSRGLD